MTLTDRCIKEISVRQLFHDERYHSDIAVLPIIQIVKHMTLHMSKYVGKLVLHEGRETEVVCKVLIDALIITLSTANTLKYTLTTKRVMYSDLDEFSQLDSKPFIMRLVGYIGLQAKACEAWDHLEDFPFVRVLKQSNMEIFHTVLQNLEMQNIDVLSRYNDRINEIERKHIFHKPFSEEARE